MAQSKTVTSGIRYNTAENAVFLESAINVKHNIYEKRHLERSGNSVTIVSDGFCDVDKEIQSELKNAGLQNILKLQELRYGTLDNAIARANDRGKYVDVSKIPDSIGERAEFVQNAQAKINALAKELGVDVSEISGITEAKLVELYNNKYQPAAAPTGEAQQGGQE